MARSHRMERIQAVVLATLAQEVRNDLPEKVAGSLTLTRAEVTRDLSQASIFFLVHGDVTAEQAEGELQKKAHQFHKVLFKSMHLRRTPVLTFKYDHATEEGMKLSLKLGRLSPPRDPE